MKTRCRKLVIRMMSSERDNQFPSWKVFGPPCRGGPGAGGSLPCGSIARLRSVWRLKCRVCGCEQADIQRNRTWPTGAYLGLAARQVPVGIEETRRLDNTRLGERGRGGPVHQGQARRGVLGRHPAYIGAGRAWTPRGGGYLGWAVMGIVAAVRSKQHSKRARR